MLNQSLTRSSAKSPKFDIDKKSETSVIKKSDSIIAPEIDIKRYPTKVWNADSRLQISTQQWLKKYGLKANHLDSTTLFPLLGFARIEGYNSFLKKAVHSKYGDNIFPKHFREDGQTFNVVAKRDKLLQVQQELENAIELYQQRLEWLSSESRRLFGVIEEQSFTIILDMKMTSRKEFDQFVCAIERLINEQIRYCLKFNFIRVQDSRHQLSQGPLLPVNKDSLANAIDWLWMIDINAATNPSNLVEALIRSAHSKENDAIYLITEGISSDGGREVLREKVKQLRVPLHIISYNCKDSDFRNYLQSLTAITGGRFHTYSFNLEIDAYESSPVDLENPKANLLVKKKVYGGSVGGIGTREDCVSVFCEIEEARVIVNQVKSLINQIPAKKEPYDEDVATGHVEHASKEEYMSSHEWLSRFGLKPRKLDFYDVLSGVCFRHCDGVVDVLEPPAADKIDLMEQQNATIHQKLINAKYCDKFAHVKWKDGTLVHVQMSSDVHRLYSERMKICLQAITRRMEWLRQGSRELFGTITEDQVYILIDTSSSMEPHINFVKDKLYTLIQEQLRHKFKVNFVAFNSKAIPWRDRLVDVTESNLRSAWHWIEGLNCQGSTNTLAALQFAIKDRNCQGIYLLTDGRPDQPTKTILSQIRLQHRLPIHTISFNCADLDANVFLCDLARETGGRFHYFNEITAGADCTREEGLEAWESEDIRILKAEYRLGYDSLEKVTKLRDECHKLAWKKEIENKKNQKPHHRSMIPGCMDTLSRPRKTPTRVQSSKEPPKFTRRIKARNTMKNEKPQEPNPIWNGTIDLLDLDSPAKFTKTDSFHNFLESLSSRHENNQEWVIDETQEIIDRQTERYKKIMQDELKDNKTRQSAKEKSKPVRCKDLTLKQWLHIYGLIPQHMTILDALAPTIIKVRPKYIPIIDKHVMSKVFEEILPISHVVTEGSPKRGYKPVVRLVNPLAVDLKGYQDKLECLLKKYRKKLRQLIQQNIDEETLAKFDEMLEQTPLGNEDVKQWILKTFEKARWPICEDELEMFLKEIYIGHKYFIQAGELLRMRKGSTMNVHDPKGATELELTNDGSSHFENREPFSAVLLAAMKGALVLAPGPDDGYFYEAQIINWPNCNDVDVQFNMFAGITNVNVNDCVIMPDKKINISAGMMALIKVFNMDNERTFYLPGIIMSPPNIDPKDKIARYQVTLYNGIESNVRTDEIVVITQDKYDQIIKNIEKKLGNDYSTHTNSMSIRSYSESKNKNLSTAADFDELNTMSRFSISKKNQHEPRKSPKNSKSCFSKNKDSSTQSLKPKQKLRTTNKSLSEIDKIPKSPKNPKEKSHFLLSNINKMFCSDVNVIDSPTNDVVEIKMISQRQPQIVPYPKPSEIKVHQPFVEETLRISQVVDVVYKPDRRSSSRNSFLKPQAAKKQPSKGQLITPIIQTDQFKNDVQDLYAGSKQGIHANENILKTNEEKISLMMDHDKKVKQSLVNVDLISENTVEEDLKNNKPCLSSCCIPTSNYKTQPVVVPKTSIQNTDNNIPPQLNQGINPSPLSGSVKVVPILIAEQFSKPEMNMKSENIQTIVGVKQTSSVHQLQNEENLMMTKTTDVKYSPILFEKKEISHETATASNESEMKSDKMINPVTLKPSSPFETVRLSKANDRNSKPKPILSETHVSDKSKKVETNIINQETIKISDIINKSDNPIIKNPVSQVIKKSESLIIKKPAEPDTKLNKTNPLFERKTSLETHYISLASEKPTYKDVKDNEETRSSKSNINEKSEQKRESSKILSDKKVKPNLVESSKHLKMPTDRINREESVVPAKVIVTAASKDDNLQPRDDHRKESGLLQASSQNQRKSSFKSKSHQKEKSDDKKSDLPTNEKNSQTPIAKHHENRKLRTSSKSFENMNIPNPQELKVEKLDSKGKNAIILSQPQKHHSQSKKLETLIKPKKEEFSSPTVAQTVKANIISTKPKEKTIINSTKPMSLYTADIKVVGSDEAGVYNILITPNPAIIFPQNDPGCKSLQIADLNLTIRELPGITIPTQINTQGQNINKYRVNKTYSYSSEELCKKCKLPKVPFGPGENYKRRKIKSI